MTTRIQIRRDTAASWTAANPVLAAGELGYVTDLNQMKCGDGVTSWSSLPYGIVNPSSITSSVINGATFVNPVGGGYSNIVTLTTPGTSSWSVPAALQVVGAKWKVTVLSGGGGGGASSTAAGNVGGGGAAGSCEVGFYSYVSGLNTMTYVVGAGGAGGATNNASGTDGGLSYTLYNSIYFYAYGGQAGQGTSSGGTANGFPYSYGALRVYGANGQSGGVMGATNNVYGIGASAPFGLGFGGIMPQTSTGAAGVAGTGYGSGGSGGRNGTGTTFRAGGAGKSGIIIIEY